MKKPIKIDEDLVLLRELADLAFEAWNQIDREYPPASFERWTKARREFEEARDAYHEYKKRTQVSTTRASRKTDDSETPELLQED